MTFMHDELPRYNDDFNEHHSEDKKAEVSAGEGVTVSNAESEGTPRKRKQQHRVNGRFARGNVERAERDVLARKLEKKSGVKEPYAVATNMVKRGVKVTPKSAVKNELKAQKREKRKAERKRRRKR